MKNKILLALSLLAGPMAMAQNTFPTNGNVGIGTLSPLQKLTIKSGGASTGGSSTDYDFSITDEADFRLQLLGLVNTAGNYGLFQVTKGGVGPGNLALQTQGGNVGIGTTSPDSYFHGGNNKIVEISNSNTSANSQSHIVLSTGSTEASSSAGSISWVSRNSQNNKGMAYINAVTVGDATLNASSKLCFATASANTPIVKMVLDPEGNVGIGTTTPNEKLSVNGKIRAKEIKVETANWPDYVFAEGYKIGTLKELESYIQANKHLPDMPSAKEAEANGVELGEMNKLLLKKQEELVLHLIEQNKRLENQQQEIDQLKKLVAKLLDK